MKTRSGVKILATQCAIDTVRKEVAKGDEGGLGSFMSVEPERAVLARADWKPTHGIFLTVGKTRDGKRSLAILSDGSPQLGHAPVTVLDLEVVKDDDEARKWAKQARIEQRWIEKH